MWQQKQRVRDLSSLIRSRNPKEGEKDLLILRHQDLSSRKFEKYRFFLYENQKYKSHANNRGTKFLNLNVADFLKKSKILKGGFGRKEHHISNISLLTFCVSE